MKVVYDFTIQKIQILDSYPIFLVRFNTCFSLGSLLKQILDFRGCQLRIKRVTYKHFFVAISTKK